MGKTKDQDVALQALYDSLPKIECQGRCWMSCGIIEMSPRERQRIKERGIRISTQQEALSRDREHFCEALTDDRRCAVYEIRPMICRLWGIADGMPCPWGCKPERVLSRIEAYTLIQQSVQAGGGDYERSAEEIREHLVAMSKHPKFGPMLRQIMKDGEEGDIRKAYVWGESMGPDQTLPVNPLFGHPG